MYLEIDIIYIVFISSKIKIEYFNIIILVGKVLNINLLMEFWCKKIFYYILELNEIV